MTRSMIWVRLTCAALAIAPMSGCKDFLRARNPSAIEEENLNNPSLIPLLVNGVVGEFQPMYSNVAVYSAVLADELRNAHVFIDNRPLDLRNFTAENSLLNSQVYAPLHRARFLADSVSGRLKFLLGDSASRDLRLARTLAYAGYTYVLLGELFCESPVNVSKAFTSAELLQFSLPRFDEAIAVATAAKATGSNAASADSLINLARVGAARAYLNLNNKPKAIEFASQVPAGFQFRVYHSANSSREYNPFDNATGGATNASGGIWLAIDTTFQALDDPRVAQTATRIRVMDGSSRFVPRQAPSFSGYTGTLPGAVFERAASLRFSSGLEAQYIVAEAEGPVAATLAFVNARRATGGQPPVTLAGDALMAELRDQRRRDFFLDGHRLGDIRRYKAQYNVNFFPTGPYPGSTTGEVYGNNECWIIPASERNGNPNLKP